MTLKEVVGGLAIAVAAGFALALVLHLSGALRRALLPAPGRLADDPDHRDRADPRRLVRLRSRPEARDHRPRLLLPGHRQHARRAALGRPRAAEADAHARRQPARRTLARVEAPAALPYFLSGAEIAVAVAVIGAVFGEWAGLELGPRLPDPRTSRTSSRRRGYSPRSPCSRRWRSASSALLALAEHRIAWWGRASEPGRLKGCRRR